MSDPVKSPEHYHALEYHCLDIMKARFGQSAFKAFCLMNAFKYLFRQGRKPGVDGDEDAIKAKHYMELAPDCSMPDELERRLVEANQLNLRQEHEVDNLRRRCVDLHIENDALQSELSGAKARARSVEEQLTTLHNASGDMDRLRALHRDQVMRTLEAEKECARLRVQLASLRKRKSK
jgi:chromosome segregation ATPase